MSWSLDARIPVETVTDATTLAAAVTPDCAVLLPAGEAAPTAAATAWVGARHPAGCSCCPPRPAAAIALESLFRARLAPGGPWFTRVVALTPDAAAAADLADALAADAVSAARFRPRTRPPAPRS